MPARLPFNVKAAKNALHMPATPKGPSVGTPGKLPGGMTTSLAVPGKGGADWMGLATDLIPYASNIVNSFRKPPLPKAPVLISKPVANRISLADAKNQVRRKIRTADIAADRSLDENSAAAVKTANMAVGLNQLSSISESEANANAQIANSMAGAGMQADMFNAGQTTAFNNTMLDRSLADIRFKQQNLADVSDKFMSQTAQRDAAALDLNKLKVYSRLFEDSGVMERLEKYYKDKGINPTGIRKYGGYMKAFGGKLTPGGDEDEDIMPIVTDADRELLKKDGYTRNLFGKNAESLYASGFRPRMYNNQLLYTNNSDNFITAGKRQRIGYMATGNKMNRVLINEDGTFEQAGDYGPMDSDMVLQDIRNLYGRRHKQLLATNKR